jgi:uncharacterized membrane protein YgcG
MTTPIKPFPIHSLKLTPSYELVKLILKRGLTPQVTTSLGIGKPYDDLVTLFDQWSDIFKRNPALFQTEEVAARMVELRHQLSILNAELKLALTNDEETGGTTARTVDFAARPYLKNFTHQTYVDLLGNAGKLAVDLQAPGLVPAVEQLGLTARIAKIAQQSDEAEDLYGERGEEMEFQKQLGSATNTRKLVEKQLILVLYTVLPALYVMNPNSEIALVIKDMAVNINGYFDSVRYLLPSPGSSTSGGAGLPDYPNGDGDDGSDDGSGGSGSGGSGDGEEPGNGGNGGSDEGSGGPLDRRRLTDRADAAVEVLPHSKTEGNNPIIINIKE